jgi:hypothetical protein
MSVYNAQTKVSPKAVKASSHAERIRAIAYSMDTLVPGVYIWLGAFTLRLGGCIPDDRPYRYSGTLHSRFGVALVLPKYRIFSTYSDTYDPRQTSD